MATLVVTNTNASGTGSLAAAVNKANVTAEADRIVFARAIAGQTIQLAGKLVLANDVTITGDTNKDGDADITISTAGGQIVNRAGNTAVLNSLVITGGNAKAGYSFSDAAFEKAIDAASAVINKGHLKLNYVYVAENETLAANKGYGGASATIINTGFLEAVQSGFGSNTNTGSVGFDRPYAAPGLKGGDAATIINHGQFNLNRSGFSLNSATGGHGGQGGVGVLYYYGGKYVFVDFNGGDGGHGAGGILNFGTIAGSYGSSGNSAVAGPGGAAGWAPGGVNGTDGLAAPGVVNAGTGSGSLVLIQTGTMKADTVSLGAHAAFAGLGGGDVISAAGGSDINCGAGADQITIDSLVSSGGQGEVREGSKVRAGLGGDRVTVVHAHSGGSYDGGGGRDTIDFSQASSSGLAIDLGLARFTVSDATFASFESAIGSQGHDTITGSTPANRLNGWTGDDRIEGGAGADKLDGGAGTDTLSYEHSIAGVTVNLMQGLAFGGDAAGDRFLNFENVLGSGLADHLKGNSGVNTLAGGAGDDLLNGAGGTDRLDGGDGHDTLTGGLGSDVFVLGSKVANADVITDFSSAEDQLAISAVDFGGGFSAGRLAARQFVGNATGRAGDVNDRFIYNTVTGELFFDSNGSAAGGSRLIATFSNTPVLTNLDFVIV